MCSSDLAGSKVRNLNGLPESLRQLHLHATVLKNIKIFTSAVLSKFHFRNEGKFDQIYVQSAPEMDFLLSLPA